MKSDVVIRLRPVRIERFLTQAELAERAGVSRQRINAMEQGQKARLSTVRRVARALGVEPRELVGEA